jgi:hypothetical protein
MRRTRAARQHGPSVSVDAGIITSLGDKTAVYVYSLRYCDKPCKRANTLATKCQARPSALSLGQQLAVGGVLLRIAHESGAT